MSQKEIVEEIESLSAQIRKLELRISKLYELLALQNPNTLHKPKETK